MNFLMICILTTLPAGFGMIHLISTKKEINNILLKYEKDYEPGQSIQEFIKIIKLYKRFSSFLKKEEKYLIILTIISYSIGYFTFIAWVIIMFFFRDWLFSF